MTLTNEKLSAYLDGKPSKFGVRNSSWVSATSLIFLENSLGRKALSRVFCRPVQGLNEVLEEFLT